MRFCVSECAIKISTLKTHAHTQYKRLMAAYCQIHSFMNYEIIAYATHLKNDELSA